MTLSVFSDSSSLYCKWMNNLLIRVPESSGLRIQVNECSETQSRWEWRESHLNYGFRIHLTSGSWCLVCYWPSASFPETTISQNLEEIVTTQSELNVKNKQFLLRETNRCYHTVSGFSFTNPTLECQNVVCFLLSTLLGSATQLLDKSHMKFYFFL